MTKKLLLMMAAVAACTFNGKSVAWPQSTDAGKAPAWCDVENVKDLDQPNAVDYTLRYDDPRDAFWNLAGHFCGAGDHTSQERRKDLEASRREWSKRMQLDDDDWRDIVAWSLEGPGQRQSPSWRVDDKRALSSLDAVEQYALIIGTYDDATYHTDALGSLLTETGRMAYLERCIAQDKAGAWALCHADALAFDPAKVTAEARAAKGRSAYERISVRIALHLFAPKLAAHKAKIAALVAKDAAYGELFGAGAAVHAQWAARKGSPLVELALAMDDGRRSNSRKAFAGCDDRTWTAFSTALARLPAKSFAALVDEPGRSFAEKAASIALDDTDVYLAANAMLLCAAGEGRPLDFLFRVLGAEMAFRPGARGPRTATHSALLARAIELDDRDARVEYPEIERPWLERNHGSSGGGQGIVARVTPAKGGTEIAFAAEPGTYRSCTKWKTTNRIDRIDSDGRVRYESFCVADTVKKYDKASPPQTVAARYAGAAAKGTYVTITEDVVTGTWAKSGGGAPVAIFGVRLK